MLFSGIPRYRLLQSYTPLEKMTRLGAYLKHDNLYIKRDDVMPLGMGGNKVRNIEFWLGEAIDCGADLLIIAGAPNSNQCRLVAATACKVGIECHILHNSSEFPASKGNSLLNDIMGVHRVCLGNVSPAERAALAESYANERRKEGRKTYIVGNATTGALGYVAAALELHAQAELLGFDIRHIVVAGSMGPTEAGLLWGAALLGGAFKIHIPSVEYSIEVLQNHVVSIFESISNKLKIVPSIACKDILNIYGDFLGEGYDIPTKASIEATRRLAAMEGIFVENTYNGKVFAALEVLLTQRNIFSVDEGVCVIHTGGLPALFAQESRFAIK